MSKFIQLIKALVPNIKSQKALDDAYLAQASDIHDLEMRMAALEAAIFGPRKGSYPSEVVVMAQTFQCPQGLAKAAAAAGPVSYTHLTLPTNREV